MRTFGSFTFEDMYNLFQVERDDNIPLLAEWLAVSPEPSAFETEALNRLKKQLFKQVLLWNEDELKMFFIGTLIELANLQTKDFKPFTQRILEATIQGIKVKGKVDFMISKGLRTASPPYFCIHEYKQEVDREGEPLGQLLIAMLSAQTNNEQKHPILGAYVLVRSWFFVVLEDNKYAVSEAYVASSDDIFQIFAILQKSKEIIQRFI